MASFTYADLARMIDHSLLQPTLTDADLEKGCLLAREYGVANVCIKPYAVPLAVRLLAGSGVAVHLPAYSTIHSSSRDIRDRIGT